MDISLETTRLLAGHFVTVEWLLVALLAAVAGGATAIVVAILHMAKLVRSASEQHELDLFRDEAEELLASDSLDDLIAFATKKLATHPRHTYGHWYLALGYFHQGKLHHAKREFEKVQDLEPGWGPDYVEPYLDELKSRIREATPKLVKD